jgi:hypothetical protein
MWHFVYRKGDAEGCNLETADECCYTMCRYAYCRYGKRHSITPSTSVFFNPETATD